MVRLLIGLAVAGVAFTIFSIVDCALFPRVRARGVPKPLWLVLIVLFPVVGATMWFGIGRGPARGRGVAPDDDLAFLASLPRGQRPRRSGRERRSPRLRRREDEERLQQLEEELANLDGDSTGEDPRDDGETGARG